MCHQICKKWRQTTLCFLSNKYSAVYLFILDLGPKIWNSLPLAVSSSTTFANSKKRLRDFSFSYLWNWLKSIVFFHPLVLNYINQWASLGGGPTCTSLWRSEVPSPQTVLILLQLPILWECSCSISTVLLTKFKISCIVIVLLWILSQIECYAVILR